MEEVENIGKFAIEGQQVECDILFTFKNNEKKYVGYTDNSLDENKRKNIYVRTCNSQLEKIKSKEEINVIQTVLKEIAKQNQDDIEDIKMYEKMQKDIKKYTELNRKKAQSQEIVEIEEEKEELEENIKLARKLLTEEKLNILKEEIKVKQSFKKEVVENKQQYNVII